MINLPKSFDTVAKMRTGHSNEFKNGKLMASELEIIYKGFFGNFLSGNKGTKLFWVQHNRKNITGIFNTKEDIF